MAIIYISAMMIMMTGRAVQAVMKKNWNYAKPPWKKLKPRKAMLMIPTEMVIVHDLNYS